MNTVFKKYFLLWACILFVRAWLILTVLFITQAALAQPGKVQANGLTIAYESMGPVNREVILLVGGTGAQLTAWPVEFCSDLVRKDYRVIRFDNRDVGLSTKFDAAGEPDWPAIIGAMMQGKTPPLAYTIDDMAMDAIGLLDALGIKKAHIVGISGGAIIAQIIAAHHPEHVLSLTVIMGTTGNPMLPQMKPELQTLIMSNPYRPDTDTEGIVDRQVKILKALGSPAYPTEDKILREYVLRDTRRCYYPAGEARQGAAALASGDRRNDLKEIKAPTVVLHGEADPLVSVEAGKDVAATIPNAELRIVPGLGHDLPPQLVKTFVDAITTAASGAQVELNR